MRHFSAYYQSVTLAGALVRINAVPDTQNVTNGLNVQVPAGMSNVGFVESLYDGSAFLQSQLNSPSLSALFPYDISTKITGAAQDSVPHGDNLYDNPIPLVATEYLNFSEAATGTTKNAYGLVEFVDGPAKPVSGKIYSIKGAGVATLSDGTFVNTPVTLDAVLPAGTYDLVGFRAEGANLIGARIAFLGQGNRPGCPGVPDSDALGDPVFRRGKLGVWGTFTNQTFPSIDCLGNTDTAQTFIFDLIKR